MFKKAVIIGRNGQVAKELLINKPKDVEVCILGSSDIEIGDYDSLRSAIVELNPDILINASAYTKVDAAETEVEDCYLVNHKGVLNLAKIAKELNIRFIHISTDFVFDGTNFKPYQVDDQVNPISVYGKSKLAGEKEIRAIYPDKSSIVRTSWVYSSHGNNFVKTMIRLFEQLDELKVVADQIGSPTSACSLSRFIWFLVKLEEFELMYHWSDLGVASWYDFAIEIQKKAHSSGLIQKLIAIRPCETKDYPTPAERPKYSVMAKPQFIEGVHNSHWTHNLDKVIKEIAQKNERH